MKILPQILLQVFLIALNAIFAAAEIAIISMNDAKLAALAAKGNKKAVRLARLTSTPAKFLATIQVAITLSGFLGSAFAADNFAALLVDGLLKIGVPEEARGILNSVSVIVITLILSYFTLVFGELVPKRFAMKKAESLALGISGLISFISKLFAPIVWFLTASTNGVLRLMGIDPNEHEESVSEEEIRMMVDAGSEKGTIDEEEKELIQNVFEFDDLSADDIATHRTDIDLLWLDDSVEKWEETIHESRHTFFPVCRDTVDNIVGVLNAKDYFRLKNKSLDNIMKNCVKPPFFVPETVKADVLFKNMKQKKNYFAIVLDEYGGMTGIVTITDILESIVGDYDEDTITAQEEEPDILQVEERVWKISGTAELRDVEEELNIALDCEDCDTFGGYVFSVLGIVPEDGETLTAQTDILEICVTEVKEHRIEKTVVTLKEKALEAGDETEE
ncbi:MAG: HlyC/CorC family transporter [Ruminococcaceae bacterium]|nr:HlyC/CorC family transporter [Oscillospiraceae bacterium]